MKTNYIDEIIEIMEERKQSIKEAIEILQEFAIKGNPPEKVFDALAVATVNLTMEQKRLEHELEEYRKELEEYLKLKEKQEERD